MENAAHGLTRRKKYPIILLFIFAAAWIVLAIRPYHRGDWLLENILVFVCLPLCVIAYLRGMLSSLSWTYIFIFLLLHSVGAHYTYSEVPFAMTISEAFGWERNHYDRFVHFAFGLFLCCPLKEILSPKITCGNVLLNLIVFCMIVSLGAAYEILEWLTAIIVSPETGTAYLGTQGDEWDAQKDILCKLAGAASIFLYKKVRA